VGDARDVGDESEEEVRSKFEWNRDESSGLWNFQQVMMHDDAANSGF
jgi:hypothetical protein